MKKPSYLICLCLLCLILSSCKSNNNDVLEQKNNEVMQTLADRSYAAKEFADSLFTDHMATQKISNYTIERTAYGFYTSETPDSIYVVGYLYSVNGSTEKYGYKVFVDENESCSVLEEGTDIASFFIR